MNIFKLEQGLNIYRLKTTGMVPYIYISVCVNVSAHAINTLDHAKAVTVLPADT